MNYITTDTELTNIADAIRTKGGTASSLVYPNGFITAINAIPSGGGGSDDYFYIEGVEAGTIGFMATGTVDVELQYSTDKSTWTNYTLGTTINIGVEQKIYWKNNKDYLSVNTTNCVTITSSNNFNVGGRINSLINNIDGKGCYDYAFYCLFVGSKVVDASNLVLNQHLSNYCYYSMFHNCTSLTTAPQLPATIVTSSCYNSMFYNCSSLTTAPQLPATTLASNCYAYMFSGCTSLTTAPALPATTLANYCYMQMFIGCTSLTTAPQLPATTLAMSCYSTMFSGCTSLTTVPELPATTLASGCYGSMFYGCSALKVYSESGEGHDKAWSIPTGGAIQGTTRSQNNMFDGVETDNVPINFPGTSGQQFTYYTQNTPV